MNESIFELAEEIKNLRKEKSDLESELSEIKKVIAKCEQELAMEMAENETQNFTMAGTTFYLKTKIHASAGSTSKEELFNALRKHGHAELIYETVNKNSLSSFIREQIEENNDQMPEWLNGLVKLHEKTEIGLRKAGK